MSNKLSNTFFVLFFHCFLLSLIGGFICIRDIMIIILNNLYGVAVLNCEVGVIGFDPQSSRKLTLDNIFFKLTK